MDFKIFSTFTGAGGLDIGFHGDFDFLGRYFPKLPFTTEYALEYNKDAINSLEKNKKYFTNTKLLHKDITENIEKELLKYKPKEYDIFLGGFPCVTFSVVGKQEGLKNDKDGQLYESFAMYVERLQPKVFIAETCLAFISAIGRICILKVDVRSLLVNLIVSAKATQKNFLILRLGSLRRDLYIFDKSI